MKREEEEEEEEEEERTKRTHQMEVEDAITTTIFDVGVAAIAQRSSEVRVRERDLNNNEWKKKPQRK